MKVKLLNQTHPEWDATTLERYQALYDGGEDWRKHLNYWLPQNAAEPTDIYADRLKRAIYHNYVGGIIGILVGYLFSEAPQVEGAVGTWYEEFLENVDRRDTPLNRFWRERFGDALVGRDSYVWVNAPALPEGVEVKSRADEEALGLDRLYLVGLSSQHVLDWGEDEHGNLVWLMFRQVIQQRTSVESERGVTWRWTYIDSEVIRRWDWSARKDRVKPNDDDVAAELPQISHGFGRMPVARLRLPKGLWALRLLHDPAVAHVRARNDLSWALHKSAHALMFLKRKFDGETPKVGNGYYLELEQDDEVGFVEPPGGSYATLRDDTKDLKEELYRVIGQMAIAADSDATRSRMSGESKARDWQATDVLMAAYADLVLGAMTDAMRIVASGRRGDPSALSTTGLDGWQSESIEAFMESSALAVEAKEYSPTFKRVIARRQAERLLKDEVSEEELATIRDEIDKADTELWSTPPRPSPTTKQDPADPADPADPVS